MDTEVPAEANRERERCDGDEARVESEPAPEREHG